jgi:SAM-dependent methyltransferase
MPQPFIHAKVICAIRSLLPQGSRIVDLSCGEGAILSDLLKEGYNVEGSRYQDNDYIIKEEKLENRITVKERVDLTQPLPYKDDEFEGVLLTEVVEHLQTYCPVVYEAGRICKKGGVLIISTPNINRLHSRFQFFLYGTHKVINRRLGWDLSKSDLYAYHISPVDLPYLHVLTHQAGFEFVSLSSTRVKYRHFVWFPLYPIFAALAWIYYRAGQFGSIRREGDDILRKQMTSFAAHFSEQLFMVYRRK